MSERDVGDESGSSFGTIPNTPAISEVPTLLVYKVGWSSEESFGEVA